MDIALTIVALVAVVTAVGAASRRYRLSAPLILSIVGVGASYLPFVGTVELSPDLVLIGLLPPLLYAAAIRTSLLDFRMNLRPIGLLSVGLVAFTAIGVGLVVWWILPVPLAAALALGAVVAPPDAVAATAIARRIGMPRRIVTILEGESLVNDATALVVLRSAVASIGGTVTAFEVGRDFALSVVGALAAGGAVAVVILWLRRRMTDTLTDVSLSLLAPFAAYLAAEEIHASGVLAVVVTGLTLGHWAPVAQTAPSRLLERANWGTIQFLLENSVFLLIGLQVRSIVEDLDTSTLSTGRIAAACGLVLTAVIVLRIVWVFPATYLTRLVPRVAQRDPAPPWRYPAVLAWAGMRGVVTLAAVFVLPEDTPHREVLVLIALVVVAGTLLANGATLAWVVRRLGVVGPSASDDALQEAETFQRAASAGLARLDEVVGPDDPPEVVEQLRRRTLDRAHAVWERLGGSDETPSKSYARLRAAMLEAEREEVLRIRSSARVPHEVLQGVLNALDVEETLLGRGLDDDAEDGRRDRPSRLRGVAGCAHLRDAQKDLPAIRNRAACERCLVEGTVWVHLRMCLTCGSVGCCDSSVPRHADRHHRETGHPVMRSVEPGESWRWCYVDELLG